MLHLPSYERVEWVTLLPGQVFLGIGAYVGWHLIQAARAVGPSGQVVAIEPDPRNRLQLENNIDFERNHERDNCSTGCVVSCRQVQVTGR